MIYESSHLVFSGAQLRMAPNPRQIISAQVVLRAASGKRVTSEAITAANVAEYLPSAQAADRAAELLRNLGFEVGNLGGNSISITAPLRVFESVFGVRLRSARKAKRKEKGGATAVSLQELSVSSMSPELRELVEAVTFTPPPAFGPTSW